MTCELPGLNQGKLEVLPTGAIAGFSLGKDPSDNIQINMVYWSQSSHTRSALGKGISRQT